MAGHSEGDLMPGYFEEKLIGLLPPVYREQDASGDLQAFLRIPAESLDEFKELIDRLPDIFDIDRCDVRFIPLLASITGYSFDPTRDPDTQRREIHEVIESYRRKGSIPAIHRSLVNTGWKGEIDETFRSALRLNKRSRIGVKLPGRIHSLGVYRIECRNLIPGVRSALAKHHPAGMKVFFLQWLFSQESMEDDFVAVLSRSVDLHSTGRINDVFVIGRRLLNSDYRLTKRQTTWAFWRVTCQSTLSQGFERAGVIINRWRGRVSGHKLNAFALNAERLLNVELSERGLAFTCEVQTTEPNAKPIVFRLVRERLNSSKLAYSTPLCMFIFRQRDLTESTVAGLSAAANLCTVTQWPQD
ncbi:MAG: phage tail protein [Armatimonadota bacterium]|nr:phage tail protein [Armatimonadota bacterium]